MPETARWFKLDDDVGINGVDQTLDPIAHFVVNLAIPVMVGKDVVDIAQTISLEQSEKCSEFGRIVPGTRYLEVTDYRLAGVIASELPYHEVDKPTKAQLAANVNTPEKARENAAVSQGIAAEHTSEES